MVGGCVGWLVGIHTINVLSMSKPSAERAFYYLEMAILYTHTHANTHNIHTQSCICIPSVSKHRLWRRRIDRTQINGKRWWGLINTYTHMDELQRFACGSFFFLFFFFHTHLHLLYYNIYPIFLQWRMYTIEDTLLSCRIHPSSLVRRVCVPSSLPPSNPPINF